MRIAAVRADARFTGPSDAPRQIVRVTVSADGPVNVTLSGRGVTSEPAEVRAGPAVPGGTCEVALALDAAPGTVLPVEVRASGPSGVEDRWPLDLAVARPGTTIHLVPHFHFDPVWWNTQAASVSEMGRTDWSGSPRLLFQASAFDILRAHLARARADPAYRFCVAEVDYLRPFLERHPWERETIAALLAERRIEVVGGTINEPDTTLTGMEVTRRNLVHGLAFQRGVLGAEVATAWQLDAFGHHPGLPSVLADAGLTSSAWARGPHHQWGPMVDGGFAPPHDPVGVQLPSELAWLGPDGRGVLTAYLAAHYSAGYALDAAATADEAIDLIVERAAQLRQVSLTDQVVLLVGTDLSPPSRWVTEVPALLDRYTWPRARCSLPSDVVAAVVASAERPGRHRPPPTTRDMNPVYTGKDVSYIDTKQAGRAAEEVLGEAETWATLAAVATGAPIPEADLDHAWRLLVYGAHHDAITGTESDQVYLDLLAGWRRAHDLATSVRSQAQAVLAAATDTTGEGIAIVVFDPTDAPRRDVVEVHLGRADLRPLAASALRLLDAHGAEVGFVAGGVERDDGLLVAATITFVAATGPGLGTTVYRLVAGPDLPEWEVQTDATEIANAHHALTLDATRGGAVTAWHHRGTDRDVVEAPDLGGELLLYPEHPTHPIHGEGPWHLSPSGPPLRSSDSPASVTVLHSPAGQRAVVDGAVGGLAYRSTLTLWAGVDRVDVVLEVDHLSGQDHLLRIRWPAPVRGGRPVVDVGEAVIGRGFAHIDVDAADHPWTLDTATHGWAARSSTARVVLHSADGADLGACAIGAAEVVRPEGEDVGAVVVALAAAGVTSTGTIATGPRWGTLAHDSSLPDVRISIGRVGANVVTEELLAAHPTEAALVADRLAARGGATVWVPATRPTPEVEVPSADVRALEALPALVVTATTDAGLAAEVEALVAGLADATIVAVAATEAAPRDDLTVAVLERGTPGCAVTTDGALHLSLLRASTAWPSGQWIDPPRRALPDGSSFQLQHWTHRFEHALVVGTGDWRAAGLVGRSRAYQRPLGGRVEPAHDGSLQPGSMVHVSPTQVELVALKPTGFPLVAGRPPGERHPGRITARLRETVGRPTTAHLHLPAPVAGAVRSDLGEVTRSGELVCDAHAVTVDLTPRTTATLVVDLDVGATPVAPSAPPTNGPAFSRYWVQNRGPAPHGGLPLAVHLHPPAPGGPPSSWSLSVASLLAESVTVHLDHTAPPGWTMTTPRDRIPLGPRGHQVLPLAITATGRADGPFVVRTTARVEGRPELTAYDEHVLVDPRTPGGQALVLDGPDAAVCLAPGEETHLVVTLANGCGISRWAEVEALSPWGTWALIPDAVQRVTLPPWSETSVAFRVSAPPGSAPGTWWTLVRALVGPEVAYSGAVPLVIEDAAPRWARS